MSTKFNISSSQFGELFMLMMMRVQIWVNTVNGPVSIAYCHYLLNRSAYPMDHIVYSMLCACDVCVGSLGGRAVGYP